MSDTIPTLKEKIENGKGFLWRVIAKNESRSAASHQMGVYLDKHFWNVCFEERGKRGTNMHRIVHVDWLDGRPSPTTRFVHYGKGRKNEYRITRLERGFEIGDMVVLVKISADNYFGCVLINDQEKKDFFEFRQALRQKVFVAPDAGNIGS